MKIAVKFHSFRGKKFVHVTEKMLNDRLGGTRLPAIILPRIFEKEEMFCLRNLWRLGLGLVFKFSMNKPTGKWLYTYILYIYFLVNKQLYTFQTGFASCRRGRTTGGGFSGYLNIRPLYSKKRVNVHRGKITCVILADIKIACKQKLRIMIGKCIDRVS